jgi:hypothetical protein
MLFLIFFLNYWFSAGGPFKPSFGLSGVVDLVFAVALNFETLKL